VLGWVDAFRKGKVVERQRAPNRLEGTFGSRATLENVARYGKDTALISHAMSWLSVRLFTSCLSEKCHSGMTRRGAEDYSDFRSWGRGGDVKFAMQCG
jgi:hypothetical protein